MCGILLNLLQEEIGLESNTTFKQIIEIRSMQYVSENEAGATFDNSFFDNSFGFLRQFKNRSFLDPVFVHATGRRQN